MGQKKGALERCCQSITKRFITGLRKAVSAEEPLAPALKPSCESACGQLTESNIRVLAGKEGVQAEKPPSR